jgi:TRAP-type C4-dicarboxylate transport system permease small subunit
MKKIKNVIDRVADYVAVISYVTVAILVLLNVADVVFNKVTGSSIQGAYEISECVLMCAVFASFAYGQTQKTHVHMTLFIDQLPGRTKFIPFFLCSLLTTAMAAVVTYASFYQAGSQLRSNAVTGILHIPYYPFYYLEVVCMVIFTITLLYDTILALLAIFRDEYAEMVHENW